MRPAIVAALATAALLSLQCHRAPAPTPIHVSAPPPVDICIEKCDATSCDGKSKEVFVVAVGETIRFCNRNDCEITLKFAPGAFANPRVPLKPGDCETRTLLGSAKGDYAFEVYCCDSGGGVTTPKLRVGEDDEEEEEGGG